MQEIETTTKKKVWSEPQLVVLEFGKTAGKKFNFKASEYSRSTITYNPS